MDNFVELVKGNGIEGLLVGLIVLVVVFLLSKSGVTVSGDQKRVANVALSVMLSGLSLINPEQPDVIVSTIAVIGSALLYELIRFAIPKR